MSDAAADYFSKDFEWDELKSSVGRDSLLHYHLLPFEPANSTPPFNTIFSHPEAEADSEAWRRFHLRHSSGKFFKERRYLLKEFPELVSSEKNPTVLEVGCGNGSTALPILRGNEKISVYACDCSMETLERAKEVLNSADVTSANKRFHPFHCDISISGLPMWLACKHCRNNFLQKQPSCFSEIKENEHTSDDVMILPENGGCCLGGVDFVTLIFTLSAVPLQRMPSSIKECLLVLKPGGLLLFRDYGLYDMTMLRFGPTQRVGFREYMRLDGTRSYFFSLDTTRDLFVSAGFIEVELEYCCVKSMNRRKGKSMQRVWVHGKFQKPF